MGEADPLRDPSPDSRAESLGALVDGLCDDFEARWKRGERPGVEDFLAGVSPEHRSRLLDHLLGIELHWRRQSAESPTLDEYLQRFPDDLQTVERHFQADALWPSKPDAGAETMLFEAPSQTSEDDETIREFGNYRILGELGRGGMGIVYRAWQPSADRYVALKLIRRDRLQSLPRDRQASVIHRFEHEAQAAGRLEHDHIVTVYEVGEIDGEHFFSMRYVEGESLTDILENGPIEGRKAAAYMEPVARAVHEAHLHGILHRDLKPQNILIDAKSDRALVLDFGLAKLAEGAEEMTEAGDVMGTPAYMSPEQAADSSRVTAKSDVYALGATFYHAVTGRPPFQSASPLETMRMVIDQTPVPPRQIDPQIDRDLETICLKCLEKDPSHRYASAEALADELHRYLNYEPIEARPLGAVARGVRWCRRYPVVAALLGCSALFFAAALVASIVGYVQTSRALDVSENNYQRARETVDLFFTRVSEESLLNQPGLQPLRQDLLEQALRYYEQFVEERAGDPSVRDELAANAYRLGRITEELGSPGEAEEWYRRALKIQEELIAARPQNTEPRNALGDTLNAMGKVLLAQLELEEAESFYRRAVRQRAQLAKNSPGNPEWQRKLANSCMNLGVVARESGNEDEARNRFAEAQNLRYQILERYPDNKKTRRDLAMGCYNLANVCTSVKPMDVDGALANYKEALALFEELLTEQPDDLNNQYRTAVTARLYGDLLSHLGHDQQAEQPYQRALELIRHLSYLNPDVPGYRFQLACLLMNLGVIQRGKTPDGNAEAAESFAEACRILEQLHGAHPDDPTYVRDLAAALYAKSNLAATVGNLETASEEARQSRQFFEVLCRGYPENDEYAKWLTDAEQLEKTVAALLESQKQKETPAPASQPEK